jgi:hypothetical protein
VNRALTGLVAAGLLVIGGIAVATAPQPGTIADPFLVRGGVGDLVSGRAIDVEVDGIRVTHELDLEYDDSRLGTEGLWVIVDLTVIPQLASQNLTYTTLQIGDRRYRMEDLPYPAMTGLYYGAEVPVRGSIAFEVPAEAVASGAASTAELFVRVEFEAQLDDIPVVTLDLRSAEPSRSEIIDEPIVEGVR